MAFIKKGSTLVAAVTPAQAEALGLPEGTIIAGKAADGPINMKPLTARGRDFDAEARGKTRCALEEAWAQSPLLPMLLKFEQGKDPLVELHALLDEIVTERMKRVFPNG